ncbi:ATP/GTP-binding protein [Streptomyces sp. NPDC058409]|uniref:GTP-binding protein n=1 Tax=Streptomyces sp. NPDC058409 TaxID=3346484 RepID=UPI0036680FBB
MVSANSDPSGLPGTVTRAAKILIAGPLGVGKTTLVGSVSEITPLRTEEPMTVASVGIDNPGSPVKTHTTVAMDFGRVTLNDELVLYMFGVPGQRRFWDLWKGLAEGAIGVVVLVDTRRLEDSFDVIGELELYRLPFVVAVNVFPDTPHHSPEELCAALDLLPGTPVVECGATDRDSSRDVLIALVNHVLDAALSASPAQELV